MVSVSGDCQFTLFIGNLQRWCNKESVLTNMFLNYPQLNLYWIHVCLFFVIYLRRENVVNCSNKYMDTEMEF